MKMYPKSYVNHFSSIAPTQEKLLNLKECALAPSDQGHMVSDATTFFKDLVLGFVYLCKSNVI